MGCAASLGSSSQAGQGRFQFRGGWRKAGIRFYPTGPVPFLPSHPSIPSPSPPRFPSRVSLFPDSLRFSGAASFSLPGSDFPTSLPDKMTITIQAGLSHTKLIPMRLLGTKVASEGAAVPREDGAELSATDQPDRALGAALCVHLCGHSHRGHRLAQLPVTAGAASRSHGQMLHSWRGPWMSFSPARPRSGTC